ncbi:Pyrroline-5-carboxylate reductase [Paraurantiacibacter namhicola]|uniref:Pyrroline-5-carboxylate reductase n=2 Tax=Paraurantiacibacter namhicola TaxID=645517 RepID=A0A1C7DAR1_9SPHN|nr:pyrroline-5-carboxylate reductase [Paraurantiacibacter namhicola]ANU08535.1 Pyrroline-5-carboxylate reductase [Paraurantiacibacter namhicola]
MPYQNILLVGCGNMAGAMLDGWIAAGVPAQAFTVVNRSRRDLPDRVTYLPAIPESGGFDAIQIGVKPHMLDDVAAQVARLQGGAVILSILAGTQLDVLEARFAEARAVVRVMPNLAVSIGKSPIALAAGDIPEAERERVKAFMDHLGTPEWVDESEYDLVTALAGSGPAFVYRFIAALADAGEELGLPREQAQRLSIAMVEGAGALAASSPHDPAELARRVASPGGVTQAGLDVLDKDGRIRRMLVDTLRAARDRSLEMAEEARASD